jgi:hypothetical protein
MGQMTWDVAMVLITMISAIVAFFSLYFSNKHFKIQIEPVISMILSKDDLFLYLTLMNSGKKPAKNISIEIIAIVDEGKNIYKDDNDGFKNKHFDLYPSESVSSKICLAVSSISYIPDPIVDVKVLYYYGCKQIQYKRKIALNEYVMNSALRAMIFRDP